MNLGFTDADLETHIAFKENVDAFKNKLRQIGFYTDLVMLISFKKSNHVINLKHNGNIAIILSASSFFDF